MKKVLLATTAIVGASFVATAAMAKPEVRVGGFMDFQVGMTTQDHEGFGPSPGGVSSTNPERGYGAITDNEVIIRASDKLDNGLAWGLKLELEANTDDGTNNQADEATLTLTGTWGRVFFGSDDGPVDTMKTGAKRAIRNAGTGGGDWRRWINWSTVTNRFWNTADNPRDTSDATKIAYITPRFAGIQAGVSFSPDREDDGRYRDPDNAASGSEQSFWELGLNYDQKFGDFQVTVAGVASLADNENTLVNDTRVWHVGAMVGYAGFKVGAGYGSDGDSRRPSGATNTDVDGWDVGIGYNMGAWDFGVSYFETTVGVQNSTGENRLKVGTVGATYNLGSGLSTYAEGVWFKSKAGSASHGSDNDGYALITGITVEF